MSLDFDWAKIGLEFVHLFIELTALFIGISFLVSLAQNFVSQDKIKVWLNRPNKLISGVFGAALGSVTPFCTCSTIPILVGLLKSKAPFAGAMAFLIASPLLNPAVITLMVTFFGLKATVIYAVSTFGFAVAIGLLLDALKFDRYVYDVTITGGRKNEAAWEDLTGSFKTKFAAVLKNAAVDCLSLYRTVFIYLLFGAFIGAAIHGALPVEIVEKFANVSSLWAIPLAAIVGIPLYIRTETMIPIASILLATGIAPGVLISLIIGGAGASLPEVTLLNSIFKKQLLCAFLLAVFTVACVTGFLFKFFL